MRSILQAIGTYSYLMTLERDRVVVKGLISALTLTVSLLLDRDRGVFVNINEIDFR